MRYNRTINRLLCEIGDLIWPPSCCGCNQRFTPSTREPVDRAFCPACQDTTLPILGAHCPVCALPSNTEYESHLCGNCLQSRPPFEKLVSIYQYGAAVADAVSRLKYGKKSTLARSLGALLAEKAKGLDPVDLVVPVPLYPKKLRARGFNQAALLSRATAKKLGVPMAVNVLKRIVDTPPQSRLGRKERLSNVAGAFGATKRGKGDRILLVDDVATTCATLEAATIALRSAGFKKVFCLTLARASG